MDVKQIIFLELGVFRTRECLKKIALFILGMIETGCSMIIKKLKSFYLLLKKKYLAAAGFDEKKYSGHSLRSGFATVAADFGADEKSIMTMTGHKTTQMVRRYIKESNLFKNNALSKINL